MSFSGKLTPLQLNALGSLKGAPVSATNPNGDPRGFAINSTGSGYHGTWTPTGYTGGTLTSTLGKLQSAVKKIYTASQTDSTLTIPYRNLLLAGAKCPALANRRPVAFKPTYAGYGSWQMISGVLTKVEDNYPPRNYPATGSYSSVHAHAGDYAWITGWPGNNTWQRSVDTYKAATVNTSEYDEYFSDGFIGTIARQAYYEMWGGQFSQYQLIVNSIGQGFNYKTNENKNISSLVSSKTFMSGTFSNINDTSTGDLSGVTLAFKLFGTDLLNLGRALDLSQIHKLGLPSVLLNTLQANSVSLATKAVDLALFMAELSTQEIIDIKTPGYTPTKEQEQKIYIAFTYVIGDDLEAVLSKLNCTTVGLSTLADLLNPAKMFSNSVNTLTVPKYNIDRDVSTSGKIYYFIYINGGINSAQLMDFEQYFTTNLMGIVPSDVAMGCGALSMSLQQVKNIRSMEIEKFAQVVANMEVPNKGLTLLNQTNGLAVDPAVVDDTLKKVALGSGNSGAYRECDFFGAAAGYPYINWYPQVQTMIAKLASPTLLNLYTELDTAANTPTEAAITTLVNQINAEIDAIYSKYPGDCDELNFMWSSIGRQLMTEQRAIPLAVKDASSALIAVTSGDVDTFMGQLERYATDSGDGQTATVLNNIADTTTVGGQSLVAALREARNAVRLGLAGGELNNNIQNYIDPCTASATATVVGGSITRVIVTNPSNGYNAANLPTITVYPINVKRQAVLVPVLSAGGIASITIVDGGEGYTQDTVQLEIEEPPQCQYTNKPQQTYNDTPYSQLVSPDLTAPSDASLSAVEAIDSVTTCNCDCWLD
jgi:hypothetical protein